MSRTVRRKNMPRSEETGYTHTDDTEHAKLHGGWKSYKDYFTKEIKWYYSDVAWGGRKSIPKPKKEYDRGWWRLHRDHHRNYWGAKKLYRNDWGSVRSKNRKNLTRWLRDEDVDVFFWEDVNTQERD